MNKSDVSTWDIVIIGAGVSGAAIARELSRYALKIAWLEKGEDVAVGTTKANSGIVHGGYADKPGTQHAKFCVAGNRLYRKLNMELHFGFAEIGSLVVAFNEDEFEVLKKLYKQGEQNGVEGLSIIDGEEVRRREPNLSPDIVAALHCSTAGVVSPYEFAIALAENAVHNGVKLFLEHEVGTILRSSNEFVVRTNQGDFKTKYVINAAGLYADKVAQMVGIHDFIINPRRGGYVLFDKKQGELVNSVVFQTPTAISKGILVTCSYHGNLLIGPDAEEGVAKDDLETDQKYMRKIVATARKSVPGFDMRQAIANFAGNRAVPDNGNDFIIEESSLVPHFINVAGIASPGLTAAPAIAEYVVTILANSGLPLLPNASFDPHRRPYNTLSTMSPESAQKLIAKEPAYGKVICRCETVSEGEILDALRREIPIKSLDALKRRVRVTMGRCQGGFCTPKLLAIMQRELGLSADKITKKGAGSELIKN